MMDVAEMREILWPEFDEVSDEELDLQLIQLRKMASALVDFQINKGDSNLKDIESK